MGKRCQQPLAAPPRRGPRKAGDPAALLLLLLLASSIPACEGDTSVRVCYELVKKPFAVFLTESRQKLLDGAPMPSQALEADQDLQLWKAIDNACSACWSTDTQPQVSSALEELCFLIMGLLQKSQGLDEKDNTKRFLFHYSKTHDSGNSDIMSSVLHPLLQLVPQLNERRLKRYKVDGELQGPGGIQSKGYFFYRPRNGKRSVDFR